MVNKINYVDFFAKKIAERFPDGNVDISSEIDSIAVDEGLEDFIPISQIEEIASMEFDSKVREKVSEIWRKNDE